MTILKITVEDEQVDLLRNLLKATSFVKNIEQEHQSIERKLPESKSSTERIKEILNEAKGKNLFAAIKDPVEWQRELRKEWYRDF